LPTFGKQFVMAIGQNFLGQTPSKIIVAKANNYISKIWPLIPYAPHYQNKVLKFLS